MKKIVILGSTGSVGRQAVEVACALKQEVRVLALTGGRDHKTMEAEARRLRPDFCVMADEKAAKELRVALADTGIRVGSGSKAVCETAALPEADLIFHSIGQSVGLEPTLCALNAGKPLALANKESVVMAGELVMKTAREHHVPIIPVDSEHSAIFQCLRTGGENGRDPVERILLTASGGPFCGWTREKLADITPEDALAHPTWKMGAKITIDSATLMNKGFEVIEAVHLFGVRPEQIEVLIHRESIVHSMVEFRDRAVIAQMGVPDMRLCAQYAMTFPDRVPGLTERLDLTKVGKLTFSKPDIETFPLLGFAKECVEAGGVWPAGLVAADEVAVSQFLDGFLSFTDISDVVIKSVARIKNTQSPTLGDIKDAADQAFLEASALCKSLH